VAMFVKLEVLTRFCVLRGCLAIKYDSCNNMLLSVLTVSVIQSASVSVWN